jgi:hypothetical protein
LPLFNQGQQQQSLNQLVQTLTFRLDIADKTLALRVAHRAL